MIHRLHVRVLWLVALLLLVGVQPSWLHAEETPSAEETARKVLSLDPTRDAKALRALATRTRPDPFLVVDALLRAAPDKDAQAAIALFVTEADATPAGEGVARLAAAWRALDEEQLRSDARHRECLDEVAALGAGQGEDAVAALTRCLEEGQADTASRARVAMERARRLRAARLLPAARQGFETAARTAEALGWRRLQAEASYEAGRDAFNMQQMRAALALEQKALELYRAIDDAEREAWLASSVGMCHLNLSERDAARQHFLRARKIAEPKELWAAAGRAALLLGDLDHAIGELESATSWYGTAAEEHQRAGAFQLVLMAKFNAATCISKLGHVDKAIEAYADAARFAEAKGLQGGLMAWMNRASVMQRAGRFQDAVTEYERLLPLAKKAGNIAYEGHIERNLYFAFRSLMDAEAALAHGERAIEIHDQLGDRRTATFLRTELVLVLIDLQRLTAANDVGEQAVRDARAAGDMKGIAVALLSRANARHHAGSTADAADDYEQAAELARNAKDRGLLGLALAGLGSTHERRGRYADALRVLDEAVAICRATENLRGLARASNSLGNAYWGLLDFDRAQAAYQEALSSFKRLRARVAVVGTLRNLAGMLAGKGDLDEAHAVIQSSNEDLDEQPLHLRGSGLTTAAHILVRLGRFEEAEQRLQEAQQLGVQLQPSLRAALASERGFLYARWEKPEQAIAAYRDAAKLHERLGEQWELASDLHMLARLHGAQGHPAEALAAAKASTGARLAIGRGLAPGGRAPLARLARESEDAGLLALIDLAATAPRDEALWFMETGRALTLLEELVNRDALLEAHVAEELMSKETRATVTVRAAQQRLLSVMQRGAAPAEELAAAERAFHAAQAQRTEALARIRQEARRVAEIAYPEPIESESLRESLRDEEALLLYHVFADGGVAVVVARKDALHLVDLGNTDVRPAIDGWLRLLSTPDSNDRGRATELYGRLVQPLQPLLKGAKRLLVSPDARLAFLPFEALLTSEADGATRLIDRYEIAYVPSGTVLAELRSRRRDGARGDRLVILGDPAYGTVADPKESLPPTVALRGIGSLGRLKHSGDEARAIAALYGANRSTVLVRDDATLEALLGALPKSGERLAVLHLACHGIFVPEHPQLSGLVLANREVLTLGDLFRRDVHADLAVLSACESGRGRIEQGEGVVGLVRGFLFAGTPRVIVSNWNVRDAGTKDLMLALHARLVKGMPAARALRETKRAALRAGGKGAHPYHWAALVLWGVPD